MKHPSSSRRLPFALAMGFLLLALPLSLAAAVTFGTIRIPLSQVDQTLLAGPVPPAGGSALHDVIWQIRLPRLVLAAGVGAGLSVCGAVMQALVKNPLADPYILGISSGASLGATAAILTGAGLWLGGQAVGLFGFAGAFGAALAVLGLARAGGRSGTVALLLSGTAVSAVCSSFSNLILFLSNKNEALSAVIHWTMGSLAGADWTGNLLLLAAVLLGLGFFCTQARTLDLMLLGEDTARTLGCDLARWRLAFLIVCALLVGVMVSQAGIIGFVGLVVPHVVRMLSGAGHRRLRPLCAGLGAVALIWADVLCRSLLPGQELPIGVMTAMVGAPLFLWLLARRSYGFGGDRA